VGVDDPFFRFIPASVTIAVGGTVTWSWAGDTFHDVTGLDFPNHTDAAKSGNLSVVFTTPGTYRFECTVHAVSAMRGTVVVR